MSANPPNAAIPAWRNWRVWFAVWLAGSVVAGAVLVWDAWPWLGGSAQAGFRDTKLNHWPLSLLWWLLIPGLVWLQHNLPVVERRWPWAVGLHALMAVAVTGGFMLLAAVRMLLANHLPLTFLPVVVHDLAAMGGWSYLPALIYLLLTLGLYAFRFHREWRVGLRLTGELQVANAQLETKLVRASLDALKMQLHPHFLFNTLNSITGLIRTGRTREAEDIVAGLGDLLRRALDQRQEGKEVLDQELEFLRRYLEIERIRFQDRLQVEFEIAKNCRLALVPSLLLQPLVENAMKHGISKDPAARRLRISAGRDGTRLMLTVYNDGPALPRDDVALGRGIGVRNTIARLKMLYGDEARLWLRDQPPHGVRAEIVLPFEINPP